MSERGYAGEIMASSKEAKQRSPEGRVCAFPSCTARLSTYNPTTTCSLHPEHKVLSTGRKYVKPPPRKAKKKPR